MMTVFSVVYNGYGRFIPQWNEYLEKQTIPVKKFVALGSNHGADLQFLKDNNIRYVYVDTEEIKRLKNKKEMGVLRNKGLENVNTEWWFYFAIDDELFPRTCEEIVNTDADAVSIIFDVVDVDGTIQKDQKSPHLQTLEDVKNWRSVKWGGYTAVRGNHDLRYNEDVEVPNLTLHFELYRRNLKVVKSAKPLVVHHRWSQSHHFKSEKDGSRKKSIAEIDKIAKELIEEKKIEMKNKKYIVKANENWKKHNLKCNDFEPNKIPEVNDQWEVDGLRLEVLLGSNKYKVPFVELVEEKGKEEKAQEELKEKSIKKPVKKKQPKKQ